MPNGNFASAKMRKKSLRCIKNLKKLSYRVKGDAGLYQGQGGDG